MRPRAYPSDISDDPTPPLWVLGVCFATGSGETGITRRAAPTFHLADSAIFRSPKRKSSPWSPASTSSAKFAAQSEMYTKCQNAATSDDFSSFHLNRFYDSRPL